MTAAGAAAVVVAGYSARDSGAAPSTSFYISSASDFTKSSVNPALTWLLDFKWIASVHPNRAAMTRAPVQYFINLNIYYAIML